jgi:hypothetical protein
MVQVLQQHQLAVGTLGLDGAGERLDELLDRHPAARHRIGGRAVPWSHTPACACGSRNDATARMAHGRRLPAGGREGGRRGERGAPHEAKATQADQLDVRVDGWHVKVVTRHVVHDQVHGNASRIRRHDDGRDAVLLLCDRDCQCCWHARRPMT